MANYGNSDQHAKAGQQSHKNSDGSSGKNQSNSMNASGRNQQDSDRSNSQKSGSTRGGTHEQHVKAGQQSHKNS